MKGRPSAFKKKRCREEESDMTEMGPEVAENEMISGNSVLLDACSALAL